MNWELKSAPNRPNMLTLVPRYTLLQQRFASVTKNGSNQLRHYTITVVTASYLSIFSIYPVDRGTELLILQWLALRQEHPFPGSSSHLDHGEWVD